MKVENFKLETANNWARAAATVTWEDCDRPTREVYFETTGEAAQDLSCNPDAFLLATIVHAIHHGEQRLFIDAEVCPRLRDGALIAMRWLRHWRRHDWYRNTPLLEIEAKTRSHPLSPPTLPRAGFMFSGGIDSLSTLRANHLSFPPDHPGYIRDGIFIHGFNFGRYEDADQLEAYRDLENRLISFSKQIGLNLLSVRTNLRHLDNDNPIWSHELQGAALSAVAHSLVRRLTDVSIGSTYEISIMQPKGSHPLLDPNYSSFDLRIHHTGLEYSRLEKTKLVADWDTALQQLRVCDKTNALQTTLDTEMQNCCKCEKCVRTMTTFVALGKLEQANTFRVKNVTRELLLSVRPDIKNPYRASCYTDLIAPLEAQGRHDLADELRRIVTRFHFKNTLKKLYVQHVRANFLKLVAMLRGTKPTHTKPTLSMGKDDFNGSAKPEPVGYVNGLAKGKNIASSSDRPKELQKTTRK